MAATLVLRTVKGSPLTNLEVDNNFSNLNTFGSLIDSNVGVLSNLTTTEKSNIVAAINEIAGESTTNVTITGGTISGVTISGVTISGSTWDSNAIANVSITNDESTNATWYPTLATANVGGVSLQVASAKLTFNPSTGLLTSTDYNSTSDITLKENILQIENPLEVLSKLNGFGFTWKDTGEKSYGLSAQQVEEIIPEIVKTRPDGHKGINYMNLIAFLVEAIKDLKQEIQELKSHK